MRRGPTASPEQARLVVRGLLGALGDAGRAPTPTQVATVRAFATFALGYQGRIADEPPLAAPDLAASLTDPVLRRLVVRVLVLLELLDADAAEMLHERVAALARALAVDEPMVRAARELAEHHTALMYADMQRHSWYNHETARRVLGGRLLEIVRTRLATLGGPGDPSVARRWQSLERCGAGTWGRAVFDFYGAHGFPLPGERHSIREVGAEHDWVHVLAGYDTSPEGEIDVFTFIAGSMGDEEGFAMLAATLGIYQNGSVHRIAGQAIPTATSGTLHDEATIDRFADAYARGMRTAQDVLDLDHFEWKDVPLVEARRRLDVTPPTAR